MTKPKEQKIAFDGFASVIEMLTYADQALREKILRNVAARDPELAERLLHATNDAIANHHYRKSQNDLNRSQRRQNVRNYGTNK